MASTTYTVKARKKSRGMVMLYKEDLVIQKQELDNQGNYIYTTLQSKKILIK